MFISSAASVPCQSAQQQFARLTKAHLPTPAAAATCSGVTLADVDGDRRLDVLVANSDGQNRLYLAAGSGRFVDATCRLPQHHDVSACVVAGDIDGDGDLDLLFANRGQNRCYENRGRGAFVDATASRLPVDSDNTSAIVLGDLDGDGDLDAVVASLSTQDKLYLNDGKGKFENATQGRLPPNVGWATSAALADLDGDRDLDLIVGRSVLIRGEDDSVFLNDGRGRFSDATKTWTAGTGQATAIALADVDGDGDADLITANRSGENLLFLNDRGRRFVDVSSSHVPKDQDYTLAIGLPDLDGDGDLDLIFGNIFAPNRVLLNDGRGRFRAAASRAWLPDSSMDALSMAVGDVTQNSRPDLVVGSFSRAELWLNAGNPPLLNASRAPMPRVGLPRTTLGADCDGDGDLDVLVVDDADLRVFENAGDASFVASSTVAAGRGAKVLASGDFNGDGKLDLVAAATVTGDALLEGDGLGGFRDVTSGRLPPTSGTTSCFAILDVDGDRDLDLVLGKGGTGPAQNLFLRNDGSGRFAVDGSVIPKRTDATFAFEVVDFDRDGDSDLVVANAGSNLLLENVRGRFRDASNRMTPRSSGARAVASFDVDGDRHVDLLFTSLSGSTLYVGDGQGRFVDATRVRLIGAPQAVAVHSFDVDLDGDVDVVFGVDGGENMLFTNRGPGVLRAAPIPWEPLGRMSRQHIVVGDLDADGDPDLVQFAHRDAHVLLNLQRQTWLPYLTRIGEAATLRVFTRVPSQALSIGVPLLSARGVVRRVEPFGVLGVDPATTVALPAVLVHPSAGYADRRIDVPNVATLVGVRFVAQSLVTDRLTLPPSHMRLTNFTRSEISAR